MNNCTFVGRLVSNPLIKKINETSMVEFCLAINDYRKTKDGNKNKRVTYLNFEAWDTGAETISSLGSKGDEMVVTASARNIRGNIRGNNQGIRFRVNKFKIFNSSTPITAIEKEAVEISSETVT